MKMEQTGCVRNVGI